MDLAAALASTTEVMMICKISGTLIRAAIACLNAVCASVLKSAVLTPDNVVVAGTVKNVTVARAVGVTDGWLEGWCDGSEVGWCDGCEEGVTVGNKYLERKKIAATFEYLMAALMAL